ncbi:hypothetical protein BZA05DRAFT_416701 [Tricharina praecox]|uniref:uncharacterized protein n=1 Tax=Tricharina praecox TaxID=43433 RepID=UPI00221EF065|nr:uncharacterized protein BZA05DRAFT_422953 [Tricharina praecox]XP_051342320.1 uncharacterized protein BZA05DRAFT_416701 [Tricharina praecox]KAI5841211.1 hypothetical protein BZA05DRAFT_422953 [Tricharina praecox]KAI5856102.1 hypothetical protein BZA05DRAFT_416701 [Tricharina praecox]
MPNLKLDESDSSSEVSSLRQKTMLTYPEWTPPRLREPLQDGPRPPGLWRFIRKIQRSVSPFISSHSTNKRLNIRYTNSDFVHEPSASEEDEEDEKEKMTDEKKENAEEEEENEEEEEENEENEEEEEEEENKENEEEEEEDEKKKMTEEKKENAEENEKEKSILSIHSSSQLANRQAERVSTYLLKVGGGDIYKVKSQDVSGKDIMQVQLVKPLTGWPHTGTEPYALTSITPTTPRLVQPSTPSLLVSLKFVIRPPSNDSSPRNVVPTDGPGDVFASF